MYGFRPWHEGDFASVTHEQLIDMVLVAEAVRQTRTDAKASATDDREGEGGQPA